MSKARRAASRLRSLTTPTQVPTQASFQLARPPDPALRHAQDIRRGVTVACHEQGPQGRVEWLPGVFDSTIFSSVGQHG